MAFCAGRHAEVVDWLQRLGCVLVHAEPGGTSWVLDGLTGVRCGLTVCGPLDAFAMFGLLLAGVWWPQVFPRLPEMVDRAAKAAKKAAAAAKAGVEP